MSWLQQLVNKSEARYVLSCGHGLKIFDWVSVSWICGIQMAVKSCKKTWRGRWIFQSILKEWPAWIIPFNILAAKKQCSPAETEQQRTDGCSQTDSWCSHLKPTEPPPSPIHMESSRARYLSGPIIMMSKSKKSRQFMRKLQRTYMKRSVLMRSLSVPRREEKERGWVTAALICKVQIRGDCSSARKRHHTVRWVQKEKYWQISQGTDHTVDLMLGSLS